MLSTARVLRRFGGDLPRGFAGLTHCQPRLSLNITQCTRVAMNRLLCRSASLKADHQRTNVNASSPHSSGGLEYYVDASNPKGQNPKSPAGATVNASKSATGAEQDPQEKDPIDSENWTRIYHFPHIVKLTILVRLKIYQTTATVISLPGFAWAYTAGHITEGELTYSLAAVTIAMSALMAAGLLGERILGAVYENDRKDKVRIAHLTFWGHRKDIVVDEQDVANVTDIGERMENIFVRISCYSRPKDPLYLYPDFGGIENEEAFERIFGVKARKPVFKVTKMK